MISDLRAGQDEIAALCDRLTEMLHSPDGLDAATLGALRWQCFRLMTAHLTFVRSFVLASLARDPEPATRAAAARVVDAAARFDESYRTHLARFDVLSSENEWDAYRRSSIGLVEGARTLITTERATINPILARREGEVGAVPATPPHAVPGRATLGM